jgi:hypothetical protein
MSLFKIVIAALYLSIYSIYAFILYIYLYISEINDSSEYKEQKGEIRIILLF